MIRTKKHLNISWLIAFISSGFIAGIAMTPLLGDKVSSPNLFILGASLIFAAFVNRKKHIIFLAILAGVALGLSRGGAVLQNYEVYENLFGQLVVINGIVSEDTSMDTSGRQKIKLKNITLNDKEMSGQVWVSTSDQSTIKRSDNLSVTGLLSEGFGNFPASIHQAQIIEIIRIQHADPARELRDWFAHNIRQLINEPEASLGIGFLTGQHSNLPEDLNNSLRILGLTHIIVASGYNLTILVRFSRQAFMRISKYWATVSSLFLIFGFVLVTGFSPSMSRAALITGLSIIAWHFGRRIHPVVLLTFVAALTAFINPGYVWGDLGWYLSFAAFAGVIILSPLIYHYFWGDKKKPGSLHQIFLETLSAQIMTAPIIAFAFSQYAPLAIPANLLILIFIPLAMILTFVAGLAAIGSASLAFLSAPATFILSYITLVVDKLSLLPVALIEVNYGLGYLVFTYGLIIISMIYFWRRTKHDFLKTSVVE
ncbi:ComEC/Rec2 family competence protein [Candidatus Saccharibacteria bacterium]|nr:ComEC/Rec2 family competence protein [Candidatus Saccharibacteria bacterium]